ncbi:MAG: leucine-rich repeat domain-containing protein, partial [Oscillospiraceae bacterium]|nr:leucine-rich repeat domain-containing protein [Oscillospiraceae bacterium]
MKILKKLALCSVMVILCSFLKPVSISAKADSAEDFNYSLKSDGTIEIFCTNQNITSAEIPSEIDGHKVSTIGKNCFSNCASMTEVSIPDTVTSLEDYAFQGCSSLTEIYLPASVSQIGDYVFDTTENMTKFEVDSENKSYQSSDGVLYDKAGGTLLKYPESKPDIHYAVLDTCQNIADWAFIGAIYLETIDLKQVKTIGEDAFYYCVALREITIPEGITELTGAVFGCCAELQQVILPSSLKAIGDKCFYSCITLQNINLPAGLQKIGAYAFCHCTDLQSLLIPEKLTTVNAYCIGYYYDENTDDYKLQDNITLYVYKNSVGLRYASTNHIAYEIIKNYNIIYIILIAVIIIV